MKWTDDTSKIIAAHCKDFNSSTYSAKVKDYTAYVKSLGGIFAKMCNVTSKPTTADEFRDHVEYVCGLMAIWGFDYWNGKTRHRWGKGSADAFYPASKKFSGAAKGGSIGQLCQGTGGRGRYTCCNYGVDTLLVHMDLKKAATDRIKTWATKYGKPVISKAALKPGDLVHFFDTVGSRSKPSTWKSWHHVAIVVANDGKKIWLADFGSRFMNSKTPYHWMPVDTSAKAGGEYGSYRWAAIHAFNFIQKASNATTAETSKKEEELVIISNPNFTGKNTSMRKTKPQYVVIHYTGTDNSTAANNVKYYNDAERDASADVFVGYKGELCAYNNDISGRFSWHCGGPLESSYHPYYGRCTNDNSIGIEMCTHKIGSDVWSFDDATVNGAVLLTRYFMQKYSIPIGNVIRHWDVTGKHCPRVDGWGPRKGDVQWKAFKMRCAAGDLKMPKTAKYGSSGTRVKILQAILNIKEDGQYGKITRAKVAEWQKAHYLTPDGIVGPKTWLALFMSIFRDIRQGNTGVAVKVWQYIIGAKPDGKFGKMTAASSRAFQKKKGLTQDAFISWKSWRAGINSVA